MKNLIILAGVLVMFAACRTTEVNPSKSDSPKQVKGQVSSGANLRDPRNKDFNLDAGLDDDPCKPGRANCYDVVIVYGSIKPDLIQAIDNNTESQYVDAHYQEFVEIVGDNAVLADLNQVRQGNKHMAYVSISGDRVVFLIGDAQVGQNHYDSALVLK